MQEAMDIGMPRSAVWTAAAVIGALALLGFLLGLGRTLTGSGAVAPPPTMAPAAHAANTPAVIDAKPIVETALAPAKVEKPKKPSEDELAAQKAASALQAQQPALQVPDTAASAGASSGSDQPQGAAKSAGSTAKTAPAKPAADDTPPY